MDRLDNNIGQALNADGRYDADRSREARRRAADGFCASLRTVERLTLGYLTFLTGLALVCMALFLQAHSTKLMILYAVVFLVAMQGQTLIKLWYWMANTKLNVMREMAQLRAELRATGSAAAPGAEQGGGPIAAAAIRGPSALSRLERTVWHGGIGLVLAFGLYALVGQSRPHASGARQQDEWRITADSRIIASTSLTLTPGAPRASETVMTLPHPRGSVQSVLIDGERADFDTRGRGKFVVRMPVRDGAVCGDTVQVAWSLPLAELQTTERGYRTELRGLVPVNALSLTVVLDADSGFEVIRDPAARRSCVFRATMQPPVIEVGSCGLGIQRKPTL